MNDTYYEQLVTCKPTGKTALLRDPQQHGPVVQHAVTRHDEDRFIGRLSASARLMAQSPLLPMTATLLFLTESNL